MYLVCSFKTPNFPIHNYLFIHIYSPFHLKDGDVNDLHLFVHLFNICAFIHHFIHSIEMDMLCGFIYPLIHLFIHCFIHRVEMYMLCTFPKFSSKTLENSVSKLRIVPDKHLALPNSLWKVTIATRV